MRKNIVAGNWKMNNNYEQAEELVDNIMTLLEKNDVPENTQLIVCPPFPFLEMCSDYSADSYFQVGAQDVSANEKGAFTGEVSAEMLKSMEIDFCIVGHSERRAYHHETDEMVAKKVSQLLANDLHPIVCCGEVLEERESNQQFNVVERQIRNGLFHLNAEEIRNVVIAYEPVWAIGTGKTATPDQAQEMHAHIRGLLAKQYGTAVADEISILYGGSCKPSNAKELFANPDVDGGLIGGASLKADDFINIMLAFAK